MMMAMVEKYARKERDPTTSPETRSFISTCAVLPHFSLANENSTDQRGTRIHFARDKNPKRVISPTRLQFRKRSARRVRLVNKLRKLRNAEPCVLSPVEY